MILASAAFAGFGLGSYGRVQASADSSGGQGEPADVVLYPSRLQKDPYLELDAWFETRLDDGVGFRVVATPALSGDLFHYDGEWDADLAIRNLYVEADGFGPVSLWAGSRMLRGDDVYLLDLWPLDEINTVGGGLFVRPCPWSFSAHVGLSRPTGDDYQLQYYEVPVDGGVGTESVLALDRQRVVGSLKAGYETDGQTRFGVVAYGEGHYLPAGERRLEEGLEEALPADGGVLAGVELKASGWSYDSWLNLSGRVASGLAAWNELEVPDDGFAADGTVGEAREFLVAFSGNQAIGHAAILGGGYLRRFADADADTADPDDRWEASVALRPMWHFGRHFQLGAELSHQWLRPDGLNPRSGEWDIPQITKIAVIPAIQVGPTALSRPQIRLQYIYSHLDDDARLWFAEEDPRRRSNHIHSFGVGAEWWISSASYR